MGKAPDAFRTISEVADWLGVQTHVLRFWESKFSQVKPLKRAGGRRYYRPADMELLGGIRKLLHEDGLTIKGAQKFIRENGVKAVAELSPPVDGAEAPAVEPPASGLEAAAAMVPETEAEVHVHPAPEEPAPAVEVAGEEPAPAVSEPEPDVFDSAVSMEGEEPAPAAELHIQRDGPGEAVDVTGEEPAPAVEPEPDIFDSAVSMEGEEPAPAAEVHIQRDGPDEAVDVTGEEPAPAAEVLVLDAGEAEAAPEQKANIFGDVDGDGDDEDELELPSFIRKPMEGRETTIPPVTPGPPPLAETEATAKEDARFEGVGAGSVPDREPPEETEAVEESVEHEADTPALAPVDFAAAASPDTEMPVPPPSSATPEADIDRAQILPLYERLLALRARMG